MRRVVGLDPGPVESALVLHAANGKVLHKMLAPNEDVLQWLRTSVDAGTPLAIEKITSYGHKRRGADGKEIPGIPMANSTLDSVYFSGQCAEAWSGSGGKVFRITRTRISAHLIPRIFGKEGKRGDAAVRAALLERYGGDGAVGYKHAPGPLYGFHGDLWSALAVAITFAERGSL